MCISCVRAEYHNRTLEGANRWQALKTLNRPLPAAAEDSMSDAVTIRGTIGQGGRRIRLSTGNGNVSIRKGR